MLSSCVIVGKVVDYPNSPSGDKNHPYMIVETDAPFRNPDGSGRKNLFKVYIWRGIAEECRQVSQPGMFVCVRGRLQSDPIQDKNDPYHVSIIAEKVVFQPQ
jgi:single-stranded DNA-binding protein